MAEDLDLWDKDEPWLLQNSEVGEKEKINLDININNNPDVVKDIDDEKTMPPPPSKGKKRINSTTDKNKGTTVEGGAGDSDHELHIWTERERRKKMRNMFANLHALLPHLPPKTDKSTIVDEAVTYIKQLKQVHQKLQKQKLERIHGMKHLAIPSREAFLAERGGGSTSAVTLLNPNPLFSGPDQFPVFTKTWTSPNLVMNVSGKNAHINVCCPKKQGLFSGICFVMEKYKLEVISAQVSSDQNRCMYMIHTHLANGATHDQFIQAFPVEEIYKQVAAEIMLWVNS